MSFQDFGRSAGGGAATSRRRPPPPRGAGGHYATTHYNRSPPTSGNGAKFNSIGMSTSTTTTTTTTTTASSTMAVKSNQVRQGMNYNSGNQVYLGNKGSGSGVGVSGSGSFASDVSTGTSGSAGSGAARATESQLYAKLSDTILQYQKNVGILVNIGKDVGTKADSPTVDNQFQLQVDVIQQLGQRIEGQLRSLELRLQSVPSRTDAARMRATHVKLTRDFRTVEATFRKVTLDVKQRRSAMESQRRAKVTAALEQENLRQMANAEESEEDALRRQMQLKLIQEEEQVNLQIMREREEEIRNINQGMHQVNEIYKDLAQIVGQQQEDIDKVEKHMEQSSANAQSGLRQVEKANQNAEGQCIIS